VRATFAQVKGLPYQTLKDYLATLRQKPSSIRWGNLESPIKLATPDGRRMLQVADTASGAVYAAFERDAYDLTEQVFLQSLRPAIWVRSNRQFWQDGLKYGPWPNADCASEHPWFEEFCKPAAA
jgi:hypothetical protein